MATLTRILAGDRDVIFEIDFDDANLWLTSLRCINNSPNPVWGQATQLSNGRAYERTFPANSTTEQAIPTAPNGRMSITITPAGKLDGVEYRFMCPA
jgi:hypothetical protein